MWRRYPLGPVSLVTTIEIYMLILSIWSDLDYEAILQLYFILFWFHSGVPISSNLLECMLLHSMQPSQILVLGARHCTSVFAFL